MEIKVYSTPVCPYCQLVKNFLKEKQIEFQEVDVSSDRKAAEELIEKTRQIGVPVTFIKKEEKETFIIGFRPQELASALKIK